MDGQRLSKIADTEQDANLWAQHLEETIKARRGRYMAREMLVRGGADLVTMVPKIVLDASRDVPHKQQDILESAIPTVKPSGVYFLMRAREVVYVGQSVDVLHRIARHRREGKVFDAFSYIECDECDLDRLETLYIRAFVPRENFALGSTRERRRPRDGRKPEPLGEATAVSVA